MDGTKNWEQGKYVDTHTSVKRIKAYEEKEKKLRRHYNLYLFDSTFITGKSVHQLVRRM